MSAPRRRRVWRLEGSPAGRTRRPGAARRRGDSGAGAGPRAKPRRFSQAGRPCRGHTCGERSVVTGRCTPVCLTLGPPFSRLLGVRGQSTLVRLPRMAPHVPRLRAPGKPQIPEAQLGQGPRPHSRPSALPRASACRPRNAGPTPGTGCHPRRTLPHAASGAGYQKLPRLRSWGGGRHRQEERWRGVTWDDVHLGAEDQGACFRGHSPACLPHSLSRVTPG